jgi:hypothetical protein
MRFTLEILLSIITIAIIAIILTVVPPTEAIVITIGVIIFKTLKKHDKRTNNN